MSHHHRPSFTYLLSSGSSVNELFYSAALIQSLNLSYLVSPLSLHCRRHRRQAHPPPHVLGYIRVCTYLCMRGGLFHCVSSTHSHPLLTFPLSRLSSPLRRMTKMQADYYVFVTRRIPWWCVSLLSLAYFSAFTHSLATDECCVMKGRWWRWRNSPGGRLTFK